VNTVFDDEAASPISSGTAPFTGSFKPEVPLSALDGINAAGTWTLKVVDQANVDVGTIDNWTLTLLFRRWPAGRTPPPPRQNTVADVCTGTGGGSGNGLWESGEDVQFSVTVSNDGTGTLSGVSATITSPTPGVTILSGTASYPSLAPGRRRRGTRPTSRCASPPRPAATPTCSSTCR
jgi:hypothetical protein